MGRKEELQTKSVSKPPRDLDTFAFIERKNTTDPSKIYNMSTAIMQAGALGWDYKGYDWSGLSNEVADMPLKVSFNAFLPKYFIVATH